MVPTVHSPMESLALNLSIRYLDHHASCPEKSCIYVNQGVVPTRGMVTIHYTAHQPNRLSGWTLHRNTFWSCWCWPTLDSTTSWVSSNFVLSITTNAMTNMSQDTLWQLPSSWRCKCTRIHSILRTWSPSSTFFRRSKQLVTALECQKEPPWGYSLSLFATTPRR